MNLRDYTFLGTTRSLCPTCRRLVDAEIIVRDRRVYFRKRCPEHGTIEDFVCSDVAYYDRHEFDQPARTPRGYGVEPERGCPTPPDTAPGARGLPPAVGWERGPAALATVCVWRWPCKPGFPPRAPNW